MITAEIITKQLLELSDPAKAKNLARFFKTGPRQYGEGDIFLGIAVPQQRLLINKSTNMSLDEIAILLQSKYHECRLTALLILVNKYKKGASSERQGIYDLYMSNTNMINNWDLVDLSAGYIVGPQLGNDYKNVLKRMALSSNMWERRIAILSCFYYIKLGNSEPAFYVIEILKFDSEDLIQKAVGWMLREIGKRCSDEMLRNWLLIDKQYTKLPRTTLRYAIERLDPEERRAFLNGVL